MGALTGIDCYGFGNMNVLGSHLMPTRASSTGSLMRTSGSATRGKALPDFRTFHHSHTRELGSAAERNHMPILSRASAQHFERIGPQPQLRCSRFHEESGFNRRLLHPEASPPTRVTMGFLAG